MQQSHADVTGSAQGAPASPGRRAEQATRAPAQCHGDLAARGALLRQRRRGLRRRRGTPSANIPSPLSRPAPGTAWPLYDARCTRVGEKGALRQGRASRTRNRRRRRVTTHPSPVRAVRRRPWPIDGAGSTLVAGSGWRPRARRRNATASARGLGRQRQLRPPLERQLLTKPGRDHVPCKPCGGHPGVVNLGGERPVWRGGPGRPRHLGARAHGPHSAPWRRPNDE